MNSLFIVTILFFVVMPVISAVVCYTLYKKDEKEALQRDGVVLGTPLF